MTDPINEDECVAADEGPQDPDASFRLAPLFGAYEQRDDDDDEPRP